MRTMTRALLGALYIIGVAGCETLPEGIQAANQHHRVGKVRDEAIRNEPPGDYFIGRRYYKQDYKFWGYVRRPGQPWASAKLVMMNEQTKLAPDREMGKLGSDNNHEYKLFGHFSDETVYEPASNRIYPEFVLSSYELRSVSPNTIFRTPGATDPARRIIAAPE